MVIRTAQGIYLVSLATVIAVINSCGSRHGDAPITRIEQIAALPLRIDAPRPRVHLKGWVTLADPAFNGIFIEDESGASRVDLPFLHAVVHYGDMVELEGAVAEGASTPIVVATKISVLRGGQVLHPIKVRAADLLTGHAGLHYVEMEGVFRSSFIDRGGGVGIRIGAEGTVIEARLTREVDGLPNRENMPGSRIRVRGIGNLTHDLDGRPGRFQLRIPRLVDIEQIEPPPANVPINTVRDVVTILSGGRRDQLIHLRGNLHYDGLEDAFLRDKTDSIRLQPAPGTALVTARDVDIMGFAEMGHRGLEIADAVLGGQTAEPDPGRTVLTSVGLIHALSPEAAQRAFPVHVRATVTYINPLSSLLFIQDNSGPTYVSCPRIKQLNVEAGDRVDVVGIAAPGDFAPIISNATIVRISRSSMPPPAPVSFDDLFSGKQDSAWVQTEGVVQRVEAGDRPENVLWVQWGNHRYRVLVANSNSQPLPPPDSRVQIRGVCATLFNASRQILGIQLYVPSPRFIRVVDSRPVQTTFEPRPIDELLRFSSNDLDRRAVVRGVVTMATPAGPSFIQDAGAGLEIMNHDPSDLHPGDIADVIGFAVAGSFGPELRDATILPHSAR